LRNLLSYLGEKTLSGEAEELKEYTVGVEACGKPPTYDPQKDAAVRVQVSRLRQKLQEFYESEGANDPYIVEAPKGRFVLAFQPREQGVPAEHRQERVPAMPAPPAKLPWMAIALALLAGFIVLTGILEFKLARIERDLNGQSGAAAFWRPLFSEGTQNTLIFGSPAFYANPSHHAFVRAYATGDEDEAAAEIKQIEGVLGALEGPRYDYASMGDAIAAQRLTAFLGAAGIRLRAVPAHLAVWDSIQDSNLIFLGAERMNPMLRRLPIRQDFELGADSNIHNRNPQPGEQAVYQTPSHRDAISYAVIATYAGLRPDRKILVITAHSSSGIMGGIDFITSPEGVALLANKLRTGVAGRPHFQVLLRVFSDRDVPVKTEYVTHHAAP
jgi:hypothetical protein